MHVVQKSYDIKLYTLRSFLSILSLTTVVPILLHTTNNHFISIYFSQYVFMQVGVNIFIFLFPSVPLHIYTQKN